MTIRRQNAAAHEPMKCFELANIPADGVADVLRLELEEGVLSIPLREFVRWHSAPGGRKLIFHTPTEAVVVTGANLAAIHVAADQGRLRILRPASQRPEGDVWIKSIQLLPHDRPQPTDR